MCVGRALHKPPLSCVILKIQMAALCFWWQGCAIAGFLSELMRRRSLRKVFQGNEHLGLPLELYLLEEGGEEREWPNDFEEPRAQVLFMLWPGVKN